MILTTLNHLQQMVVRGSKSLATLIRYVPVLLEPLQIMPLLENIGYDSSRTWISLVHATTILSNREDTYYMSAEDSMGIGTLEETR